jgi:DNA-binding NarL/FixJ family response regulator
VADEADGQAAVDAVRRPMSRCWTWPCWCSTAWMPRGRRAHRVSCPVILLSGLDDARFIREALKVGVRGFVQKSQGADDLVHAIEEVRNGRLYVSPGASQAIVDACATPSAGDGRHLTPRERQVLQLVGEGKSTKQIAEALHISVKTAEFHRGRLMKKLNVHDTANLVRYAIREGWIAP